MSPRISPGPRLDINRSNTHILPSFTYHEPHSLKEALRLLDELGGDAKILAGGTDLLVYMKYGLLRPRHIVNIKRIPGLRGIEEKGGYIAIGALTRLSEIERSPLIKKYFPALHEAARSMASVQVRNMATIGGNLCNASPAADTAPPLMVYKTIIYAVNVDGEKKFDINEFFKGPKKTVLEPRDILTWILVWKPPPRTGSSFIKIARTMMDLAKINVATRVTLRDGVIEEAAVALGAVAPTPVRARSVEEELIGHEPSRELVEKASRRVVDDIDPITDVRSTAEYRRSVAPVVVRDSLLTSLRRAGWIG